MTTKKLNRLPQILVLVLGMLLALGASGCTAAQSAAAQIDLSSIATASESPVPCAILTAVDNTEAGKVCGIVSSSVATLADLINGILKALTPPAKGPALIGPPPPPPPNVIWKVADLTVILRGDVANDVKAAVKAKAKAGHK